MKRILITGKNSYVGNAFVEWVAKEPEKYHVDKISVRDNSWKSMDFSSYDVILHVAGIAHVSTDPKMEKEYYKVNRDLTIEIAEKAKKENVKQFIFLSSIIVYGENKGMITLETNPNPQNFYGRSKLEAEYALKKMDEISFKTVILRPPMIYGRNTKGNYVKLSKVARYIPLFPDIKNKRSMLYIDNLSHFVKLIIDNEEQGIFFPQNKEYVCTSELVKEIAKVHEKKVKLIKVFNPIINMLSNKVNIFKKIFGDLYYKKNMSFYLEDYNVIEFQETIKKTELEK